MRRRVRRFFCAAESTSNPPITTIASTTRTNLRIEPSGIGEPPWSPQASRLPPSTHGTASWRQLTLKQLRDALRVSQDAFLLAIAPGYENVRPGGEFLFITATARSFDLAHLDLKTDGHRARRLRQTCNADQISPSLSKLADILQGNIAGNFNHD